MTMHERIMSGKLFTDMCEGMPQERLEAKRRMKAFNDSDPGAFAQRAKMIEEMLGSGKGCWIEPPFYFCYGTHIHIGENSYLNVNCNFIDDGMIYIGKNVLFGPVVTIATVGHPTRPDMREYMYTDPVTIGDHCWIGAGATICPGVTIGDNTVIGAGSVVTQDIPANVIAVGNPCRVVREISDHDLEYYYKDRRIEKEDLEEEARLRQN
ncbi:MAG: galactoside O-acetyltransferase [Lachnospiraceae bacterium]|nr:galactoside O-acetyltransferase [Lachnospiraceae bacterium]